VFPTEKTDLDELCTINWSMSDRSTDINIGFIYFGLQERVVLQWCVLGGFRLGLVSGLRCEGKVCVT
jgi:hypothetical protein